MAALLLGFSVGVALIAQHPASVPAGWAQLLTSDRRCVDSNGGGPVIDLYSCVGVHAGDAANELFRLTATGEWLGQAATGKCVAPSPCAGSTGGLCLGDCNSNTTWEHRTAGSSGTITLAPASSPNLCLTAGSSATLKLSACTTPPIPAQVFAWGPTVAPPPPPPPVSLRLDGSSAGLEFDGHGLLSAGASSRLLRDYSEPYRSQILDYLFKPQFGASLDIIKVEIGGDCQSTSGTEPSHMHSRDDLGCARGYEGWLLQEAKRRNPRIKTWGLSWGVPAWISEGSFNSSSFFTRDNINYQTKWLECIKETTGISVDFIGIWNERPSGPPSYTVALRESLDAAGFGSTQIVLPDGGISDTLVHELQTDKVFSDAVYALGQHGCGRTTWSGGTDAFTQKSWCAESEVSNGWGAAQSWAPALNQNFISANQTSTTSWSLIWSVPEALSPYQNRGAMMASEPWSGHYFVDATIWMHAHWTQVTEPGWTILGIASGGSGYLDGTNWQSGTYVTCVSPDREDFSVVVECLHCKSARTVELTLENLPTTKPLRLWKTNESSWFRHETQDMTGSGRTVTLALEPGSIYSLTTVDTATHGNFSMAVPPSSAFPLPHSDTFDDYDNDTLAKYFADQGGSFSVVNGVMQQMAPKDPGPNGWVANQDPISLIGDLTLTDVSVAVHARLNRPSSVLVGGSEVINPPPLQLLECDANAKTQQWAYNEPYRQYYQNAETSQCLNQVGCGKDADVIQYNCEAPSATQCGNLEWQITEQLQLKINATGQCATAASDKTAHMADCKTPVPASQRWSNAGGGLQNGGLCLSTPPIQEYVAICARISAFAAFDGNRANNGVCFRLIFSDDGRELLWSILESTTVLAHGKLSESIGNAHAGLPSSWHVLGLTVSGDMATASINGSKVGDARVVNATHGSASLGSSYADTMFDNFSIKRSTA